MVPQTKKLKSIFIKEILFCGGFMFNNIDKKIKILAICITIIGCICSFACAVCLWSYGIIGYGFLSLIGGCLVFWIISLIIYGFGELITQATNIAKSTKGQSGKPVQHVTKTIDNKKSAPPLAKPVYSQKTAQNKTATAEQKGAETWTCKNCGAKNLSTKIFCRNCGSFK